MATSRPGSLARGGSESFLLRHCCVVGVDEEGIRRGKERLYGGAAGSDGVYMPSTGLGAQNHRIP